MLKRGIKPKKIYLLLFSIILFVSFMSFTSSYDLKIPTNATSCNITVEFPNSTNFIINKSMTSGVGYFNYSFSPTISNYNYYSNCGSGSLNINGQNLTSAQAILYFLVTLFSFFIFLGLLWLMTSIKGENDTNSLGEILSINYKKYIKWGMLPLIYVSFIWFFNFIIGLSNNYLGLTLYSNTLEIIFRIMTKLIYPIIIFTILFEGYLLVKDNNIIKEYKSLWSRF